MATDYEFFSLETIDSTQREAQQRWNGTPVVVYAESQTNGRGRSGNTWLSAERSVAVSVAFATKLPAEERSVLALVAGLCAHSVLSSEGFVDLGIKWPNDLLDGSGAKVAGTLVESSQWMVTVGLGVNLWSPESLVAGAGWLYDADPGTAPGLEISQRFAEALLLAAGEPFDRQSFVNTCVTVGSPITWDVGSSGVAVDIATDGRLVVETPKGVQLLSSGTIHHVRTTV